MTIIQKSQFLSKKTRTKMTNCTKGFENKQKNFNTLETLKENWFSSIKNRLLSVKTFNSQEIILNYEPDFSIKTYKSKIKDLEGFPVQSQKL